MSHTEGTAPMYEQRHKPMGERSGPLERYTAPRQFRNKGSELTHSAMHEECGRDYR